MQQFFLQDFAGLRVERGERFVHQQNRRVDRQRAHEADALLHAAGELVGIMLLEAGQADEVEIMRDALLDMRGRRAGHGETEGGVVINGFPGQQAEVLEHHGHAFGRAGDRVAVDQQSAVADVGQAGNAAQQRRLAATARPDDA